MNLSEDLLIFDTIEEGQKNLDKACEIRNMMGGALYWSIADDDCTEIAGKLSILTIKLNRIKKTLDGISIKVIESYIRIKKLECLDISLNIKEYNNSIFVIFEGIELKYIEKYLNDYKKDKIIKWNR